MIDVLVHKHVSSRLMELVSLGATIGGPAAAAVLRTSTGAEAWLGCSEGIARAVLEHRQRPSIHTDVLVATPPVFGLGSLLLRMEADGVGELMLIGSPGLESFLTAIAPSTRISHPRVNIVQCCSACSAQMQVPSTPAYDGPHFAVHPVHADGFTTAHADAASSRSTSQTPASAWHAAKQARLHSTANSRGAGTVPSLEGFKGHFYSASASQFPRRLSRIAALYGEGSASCVHTGLRHSERPLGYIVDNKVDRCRVGVLCSDCTERSSSLQCIVPAMQGCDVVSCLFDVSQLSPRSSIYSSLCMLRTKHNVRLVAPLGHAEASLCACVRLLARLNCVRLRELEAVPDLLVLQLLPSSCTSFYIQGVLLLSCASAKYRCQKRTSHCLLVQKPNMKMMFVAPPLVWLI